jgi:phosphonate transport system permease protein
MPEKISIMNPREKQVYTWFLVVVLVLFCLATYISRFNPLEVLWEQGEFWKFLFQDFLPPRFNANMDCPVEVTVKDPQYSRHPFSVL